MFSGVALALSELPLDLVERHDLGRRLHDRGGEREVQFLFREAERLLPVWHEGRLRLVPWGNRRGESRFLPCTGWTWQTTIESGGWADRAPAPVVIPATLGLDRGVWFRIRQGVRGVLVADEKGLEHVYVICEPASHYYQVMTRNLWMPVLIDERI
jgi:hypothetical protein